MSKTCSKCSATIEQKWKFCPDCATPISHEAEVHPPPMHELAPVKGGFSGLLFGVIAAPVLIIAGGMICLTGLGIFLGVPLIVAGFLAPLIGPMLGVNALHGPCPWCAADVSGVGIFDNFACPTCNRRIVLKKREMLRAE